MEWPLIFLFIQKQCSRLFVFKMCIHWLCVLLQPFLSQWRRLRDLQSPCPDESTRSVDIAQSHRYLLPPVAGQQGEKPTLKSAARSST